LFNESKKNEMGRALITGGNGLVGTELTTLLLERGFEVYNLSRSGRAPKGAKGFKWDYENDYVDSKALEDVDVIFHLVGASIADKRWTNSQKKIIIESRTKTAQLLFDHFSQNDRKPTHIISASGSGYYGYNSGNKSFDENDPLGDGFLAEVTRQWENSIKNFSDLGIKTTSLRIGMVLSQNGGALEKLKMPIKLGVGSPIGSGKQIISWIHISDLVNLFIFLYEQKLEGVYNGVASETLNNKDFTKGLASALNRPLIMPNVPAFVLKLMMGEMATEIILGGNSSSNKKVVKAGFQFEYDDLKTALEDLLKPKG